MGSFDATTWQKIAWNLADWKARLRGRFQNALGAHAGFERAELVSLLSERFDAIQVLTEEFLSFKYRARLPGFLLDLLLAPACLITPARPLRALPKTTPGKERFTRA